MTGSARKVPRSSTRILQRGVKSVQASGTGNESTPSTKTRKRAKSIATSDASESYVEDEQPVTKKRKKIARAKKDGQSNKEIYEHLFDQYKNPSVNLGICRPPGRRHPPIYHRPQLLDDRRGRNSLLKWFDSVNNKRAMPWRKPWINPGTVTDKDDLRQSLERRAYEVWISEIMLQQTRVAVVIDYWNRWMAKWPTIHDLAAAESDDVLAAWRGLGYYSRATRIHQAAKLVCNDADMMGLLPAEAEELKVKVPGVGPYTAGAISSIVFGRPAAMVDGNVLRVLSRQMGVFGDVKTDKSVIDMLWASAESLVKAVAKDTENDDDDHVSELQSSDRPGRWGQALMELGSTICTPKPNCAACPITSTCRAYGEGARLATQKGLISGALSFGDSSEVGDIEDCCQFCKPFEELAELMDEDEAESGVAQSQRSVSRTMPRTQKQATLSSFFTQSSKTKKPSSPAIGPAALELITNHARKFPVKAIKKVVRQEETLVCAIRRSDGRYLIQRRPEKGLLAGLWEFPSQILSEPEEYTMKARKVDAEKYVMSLLGRLGEHQASEIKLNHVGELASVPWLFSHIKLTMHVHLFSLETSYATGADGSTSHNDQSRWTSDVEGESMGTGMRKCWAIVKDTVVDMSEDLTETGRLVHGALCE